MAGLVPDYGSSDEEDVPDHTSSVAAPSNGHGKALEAATARANSQKQPQISSEPTSNLPSRPEDRPILGPTIPADVPVSELLEEDLQTTSQSPYSANRALLRDLTLPTVPNYNIAPSPPGSPIESTNSKFTNFLKLKKQGVHFNEKLARSSAMKNPSLMPKLMDFANIDEAEQYATTLPKDLWNPQCFPEYVYKEQLSKSQQEILSRKEQEKSRSQRDNIDFVPASASGDSSRSGTPGGGNRNGPRSAAERVMAGLDRGKSHTPPGQGIKRKSRFDT